MRRSTLPAVAILALAASSAARAGEAPRTVDFRYALPWWQTSICLPDDPEKPLVGKEGQFFFDYGNKGPRQFAFSLAPGVEGEAAWLRQETASARAPVVRTWWDAAGVEVLAEAFLVIPDAPEGAAAGPAPRARPAGPAPAVQRGWAKPSNPCDPGFADVAVGNDGAPIAFDIAVPAGSSATVVFGLCEGWWDKAGQRPLRLTVEGGAPREADPVKDFGGKNVAGLYVLEGRDADGDGSIRAAVEAVAGAPDRNTILNVLWVFTGAPPPRERILGGEANGAAHALVRFGGGAAVARRYAAALRLKNAGAQPQSRRPVLRIQGVLPVTFRPDAGAVAIGGATRLLASAPIEACDADGKDWVVRLAPVEIPAGQSREVAFTVLRSVPPPDRALSAADAARERDRAVRWWEGADLPWDTIQVPDPGIQALLQSCVRNIWQAREIKNGQPAFHVGPTCYRGLWVVDGSFLLESAALVGRAAEARAGIQYILGFQQPDGRIQVMPGGLFHKENGIVLWMCSRHAALTQDKAWLESVWPKLERIVAAIRALRERSRTQPPDLDDGLMPTGFIDGGIGGNVPGYSNVYWNLAGLKAAIGAAEWLGKKDQAAAWRAEYDDFMAVFRKAAARDRAVDPHGNPYLPTVMGEAGKKHLPQRGQWAFLHSVYPGQVFAQDDPLVQGNLAMLRATKQQGLVFGTGWDAQGIWTYAASFYGHAVLWQGGGAEAAQVLYDYANHAAPVRVWREEQRPVGKGGHEVGDMPHNWASAEFIRLAVHLVELDRGSELHLLEGLPREWTGPGMVTRLNGVPTPFGPLRLSLAVDGGGRSATLTFQPLAENCTAVVVHLPDGTTRRLPPGQAGTVTFPVGGGMKE
jgi:hypothetical protein